MSDAIAAFPSAGHTSGRVEGQKPVQQALTWLNDAMATVQKVFPWVQWSRDVDPALSDEFDAALEGRFWLDTLDQESFMNVWRRFYGAHL